MVGLDSEERLHKYVFSLLDRLKSHDPLTELDWIRAMLLAELCWGSCILGAASDYPTIFRYEPSLAAIRSLQRKIVTDERIELLIDNALPMVRPER